MSIRPCMSTGVYHAVAFFTLSISSLGAAETGDFDGDGRLSIADVHHQRAGNLPAPGSIDAFQGHPCFTWTRKFTNYEMPGMVYLESLRRKVPDPGPSWYGIWSETPRTEPVPSDPRIVLRLERAVADGAESDRVTLQISMRSFVPIEAFSIILEAEEAALLRPVYLRPPDERLFWVGVDDWTNIASSFLEAFEHALGDYPVWSTSPAYFATGGRFVISYNLMKGSRTWIIAPGADIRFVVEGRLPRGARAGTYDLRILDAEMLLEDGTLLAPEIEELEEKELLVLREVTAGWDEGVPPIRVDEEERRVLGKIEFRVVGGEGHPGDTVPIRVQMRTEVPLNWIHYRVDWPPGSLTCQADLSRVVFANPEDGNLYLEETAYCFDLFGTAFHEATFFLSGYTELLEFIPPNTFEFASYPERLLEYFKPLGEWTDLTVVDVEIPDGAGGGTEIPLVLTRWTYEVSLTGRVLTPNALFSPFAVRWLSCGQELWPDHPPWTYDISYEDGTVRVLGDEAPGEEPPPAEAGIRIHLSDATGRPGDLVEVSVLASTDEPLSVLRLGLEADEDVVEIEAIETDVLSLRTQEIIQQVTPRGTPSVFLDCVGEGDMTQCWNGVPFSVFFRESPPGFTVIDITVSPDGSADYPGRQLQEIARLRVRIKNDPSVSETMLRVGAATFTNQAGFPVETEAGGILAADPEEYVRAPDVRDSVITLEGGRSFIRGDANLDGGVNLADAVFTLGHLFGGAAGPECGDSADSDDNGVVNITDPILLLESLFQGGGDLPAPYPECGQDPTEDVFECPRSGCPR